VQTSSSVPSLAPVATPSSTPAPTPSPIPPPEAPDVEVFGFLPYWSLEDAPETLDTDLVTTVAWFGVEASGNGSLVKGKPSGDVPPGWEGFESEAFRDLQARLQADGIRVVLTVQRFGWTEGGAERTQELLGDPKARRTLARQLAELVEERGLDGVNLDVEPLPAKLSADYVALVREVRSALDGVQPGLHLSVDVTSSLAGYDLAGLTADGAADAAIIMAYDYRGGTAATSGAVAPLDDPSGADIRTSVAGALEQAPADRIIVALPWYGRAWTTATEAAGSDTLSGDEVEDSATIFYAAAAAQAERSGRIYEEGQESAWTAYPVQACPDCPQAWRQAWYDDPDSFGAKVDLALSQELGGIGIWALGFEGGRPELWWALRSRLSPVDDASAPNGSAYLDPELGAASRDGLPVVEGAAPLLLYAADEEGGSGLAYVRIGLDGALAPDGSLVTAVTYPAAERITIPLGDPASGGSAESGPRAVHVQWRDVAGNWSVPLVVDVWAQDPAALPPA
jgi:spore germination protein YaaH